jgi:hypothetical protein
MNKTWDSVIKRLAQHNAQALLDRFVPGAEFIRFLPEGLEPVKRSKQRTGKKQEEAQHYLLNWQEPVRKKKEAS